MPTHDSMDGGHSVIRSEPVERERATIPDPVSEPVERVAITSLAEQQAYQSGFDAGRADALAPSMELVAVSEPVEHQHPYIDYLPTCPACIAIEAALRPVSEPVDGLRDTLEWLQVAMGWQVFRDYPNVGNSTEMRDIRERIDAALAATPAEDRGVPYDVAWMEGYRAGTEDVAARRSGDPR